MVLVSPHSCHLVLWLVLAAVELLVGDVGEEGRFTGGDKDFWLKMEYQALSIGKMLLAEG